MQWIKKAWRGEEKLWKVFWLYGVLGGTALRIGGSMLLAFIAKATESVIPSVIGIALYIVYVIWVLVSEWKCAFNLTWRFWGYVVRILVVLYVLMIPITVAILVGQDLIHAAECRVMIKNAAITAGADPEQYKALHMEEYNQCVKSRIRPNIHPQSPAVKP